MSQSTPVTLATSDDWWKQAVVYQIYPRSFADSNGDGIGDLRGIINKLDYLAALGVDAVWLSPIYTSPQADNGYDIADYQDIDPVFGTLADFDEVVQQAHSRGIRVVMDLVVNHTSDEHAWFKESRSSRNNPKRDWYIWRKPREGFQAGQPGAEPNNWGSFFSGPAWELDEETGEYYLHIFHRKQPDLNWENPEVRQAVYAMMRWWLDRGVDGFRMDVINFISKVPGLPDGPHFEGSMYGAGFPYIAFGPRLHEFLQEMHREVFEGRHGFITVGETPGATIDQARLITDPAREELNMVFQFEHMSLDHDFDKYHVFPAPRGALAENLTAWQNGLAERGWNSLYLCNHDQPRSVSRFGDDSEHWYASATALATALHLLRGTPYVYQGEELGMTNFPWASIEEFQDVEAVNYWNEQLSMVPSEQREQKAKEILAGLRAMSRDNARTPVQWDAGPEAGFTSGTPWLAVNPNKDSINAAQQVGRQGSVFEYYRALISLRHHSTAVAIGTFERIDAGDPAIFAYRRSYGGEQIIAVTNLCSETVRPAWPAGEPLNAGSVVLANRPVDASADPPVRLAPWEARVYATPGAITVD